jgi:hypothetical protein
MRYSSASIQHFNAACRAARRFPELPASRLIMSLSDFDLPVDTYITKGGGYMVFALDLFAIVGVFLLFLVTSMPEFLQETSIELGVSAILNLFIIMIYFLSLIEVYIPVILISLALAAILWYHSKMLATHAEVSEKAEMKLNDSVSTLLRNVNVNEHVRGSTSRVVSNMLFGLSKFNPNTRDKVFPTDVRIIIPHAVSCLLDGDDEEEKLTVCASLLSIIDSPKSKTLMLLPEYHLISTLLSVLADRANAITLCRDVARILRELVADEDTLGTFCFDYPISVSIFIRNILKRDYELAVQLTHIFRLCSENQQVILGDVDTGYVSLLVKMLYEDFCADVDGELREEIAKTFANLAEYKECRNLFVEEQLHLLPALAYICRSSSPGSSIRVACTATLHYIALHPPNLLLLGQSELHIIDCLVNVIETGAVASEARANALSVLCQIASVPNNRVTLSDPEYNIFPALVDVLHQEEGKMRIYACAIVSYLATILSNQQYMASFDLGLLSEIIMLMRTAGDTPKVLDYCCSITRSLSGDVNNKYAMTLRQLGLLQTMVKILNNKTISKKTKANACATFCNLAVGLDNRMKMAQHTLGLVKALLMIIQEDTGEARVNACATLSYLSLAPENVALLLDPELNIIEILKGVIFSDTGKARINSSLVLTSLHKHLKSDPENESN